MKIQFFWHSFFKITFPGVCILVDPFIELPQGENSVKCAVKCPVSPDRITGIDAVFISNEHFDHFDRKLVELVAGRDSAMVVGHESVLNDLNIPSHLKHAVKVGDRFNMRGILVSVRGAHYPNSFYPLSFEFTKGDETLFFAGNTALMDSFSEIKSDVAILPIGGSSTMDVVDAVRATKTMKPKYVIPMHYNSFESIAADPMDFKARIENSILKTVPVIMKPGQVFRT
ncbi:MAG: MBL fold metallo-hydrolase [Candidatus Diapherotrites archaeon]|uniref:MBL fold metallo-hydrolase n=1 Tax=Candidatus Iainarchaeum sp. TaxID=3101447 RepID=A0A8T3YLV1_9ARCH|nr:MBL fold metallo-hydrolase [Candidatus Diapherotrites archaeon]